MNSILKDLLRKIIIVVILLIVKKYIDLNLIKDSIDNIVIVISALLWDFNPFTYEITKVYFNGNSGDEGEGSNRQNNNIPNQDSSISPHEEASEEELIEDPEIARQKILWEELLENEAERRSLVEEIRSIYKNQTQEYDMLLDKLDLEERGKEINKLYEDIDELEDESMISEAKHQLTEKIDAANEKTKSINNEMRTRIAEIKKPYLDSAKSIGQEWEKNISERNSE